MLGGLQKKNALVLDILALGRLIVAGGKESLSLNTPERSATAEGLAKEEAFACWQPAFVLRTMARQVRLQQDFRLRRANGGQDGGKDGKSLYSDCLPLR